MGRLRALAAAVAAVVVMAGAPAPAAQLLTDGSGYAGPVINIGVVPDPGYYFTNAPQVFGDITVSGDNMFETTVYGQPTYGFGDNGISINSIIIATGISNSSLFIDFASPVAVFGAGMNYVPGIDPVGFPFPVLRPRISAYDSMGDLIASFNLEVRAPINTGGMTDVFAFRGIDGQGRGISRFVVTGSYIGIMISGGTLMDPGPPLPAVPEPGQWLLMLAGFGCVGIVARRRRAQAA